ncbi:MAG: hypothetical protein RLZZ67_556 [Candidatus Parcubacteria bacterium]|jgi:hypothetical protein
MKKVKEIAYELSKGNIEKAAELRLGVKFDDASLELEVIEIARQAIISYLKKGDTERALETKKFFKIPTDLADEALKQAVLSSYCDGDLKRMLQIRDKMGMSTSLKKEVIEYCESWGRHEEAKAMRLVFLG